MLQKFEGKLIIFTAPSGAGKTTIVRHILSQFTNVAFSVSACTREPRNNEQNGVDYYFLTVEEFKNKIDKGDFLEWETFYGGQFYGTLRSEVDRLWMLRKHVLFDIDVKGALNLKKIFGDRALTIFVKPPNETVLIERLRNRGTENEESLKRRLDRVKLELTYEKKFDIQLLNDDLNVAKNQAEQYVRAFLK